MTLSSLLSDLWVWIGTHVLSLSMFVQLFACSMIFVAGGLIASRAEPRIRALSLEGLFWEWVRRVGPSLVLPVFSLLILYLFLFVGHYMLLPVPLFQIVASLLIAWILIRLAAASVLNRGIARFVGFLVWIVAALDILNVLEPVTNTLKAAEVSIGKGAVSAYDVIWGISMFALTIWVALIVSRIVDRRLQAMSVLAPSMRVLLGKMTRIALVSIAFLTALNASGIDLTVLAVFGGALGVGLGFGMQKVVSNFVSGLILLMDRSIKPGDVIEIQGTYGQINNLAARYTSVVTRDGTEFLVPNEDMITQTVVNWSHTHKFIRRHVPVIVDYKTDLRQAMDLMNKAAASQSRVVHDPAPRTLIRTFGDHGVELELRFWITDPENGVSNISSDVMLDMWDKFKEAGIKFPFPQMVLHKAKN